MAQRKARVEGAKASRPKLSVKPPEALTEESQQDDRLAESFKVASECIASAKDALVEEGLMEGDIVGPPLKLANPVPGDDGEALERIVEFFKRKHPDLWQEWQNAPLQYGLEAMACRLKGQG